MPITSVVLVVAMLSISSQYYLQYENGFATFISFRV